MTLDNNTTKSIAFGSLIIVGMFASLLAGHSSNEVIEYAGMVLTVLGGAGLFTTDKFSLKSGGNEEGNEKN
jgi:hypothetical protein